ncbi:MAG: hypothetical protein M3Z04_25435 [Chloroflexota bacterium]|nr:hypothetical protein [Chloroflexota bacterium]
MISRRVALAAAGGNLALGGAGVALAAHGGGWLLAGAAVGLTLLGTVLDYPWQARRQWLTVQYSTPPAGEIGELLLRLAAVTGQGVTWIWRRQDNELHAFLGIAAGPLAPVERALAQRIPGLRLTLTAPPPPVPGRVYRAPLPTGEALFDGSALLDPSPATPALGDSEIRIQLTPQGAAILLSGTLPPALTNGLPSLWRPWRRLGLLQRLDAALLRRYGLLDVWPTPQPGLCLPPLDHTATAPLNSHTYRHQPLPAGYTPPSGPMIPLGWTTGDGQPVALPLTATAADSPLCLQGPDPVCGALLAHLVGAVVAAGGSVLHLDPHGDRGTHLAAALPTVTPHWIDLAQPGNSRRLNLLAPPPRRSDGGIDAQANALAVEFLRACGALPIGGDAAQRLCDEAYLQLATYYRSADTPAPPPVPTLWTLYQRLTSAGDPGPRLYAERAAWPSSASEIHTTLTRILTQRAAESSTDRRFAATALRQRLRPLLEQPSLIHFWRDAAAPPTDLTAAPGLWLGRLTVSSRAEDQPVAAHYAAYLLACVAALAAVPLARPLWLILEDAPAWIKPQHLAALTAGGVMVVWTTATGLTPGWPQRIRVTLDLPPAAGGRHPGTARVQLPGGVTTIRFTAQEP